MTRNTLTVINRSGLHARPAATFVKEAKRFQSALTVCANGKSINGKSMVSLLSAGICYQTQIELCAEGPDEVEAIRCLTELLQSGCGENIT